MTAFTYGDVVIGGSHGFAEQIKPDGTFIQHLVMNDDQGNPMRCSGITFDGDGNMYTCLSPMNYVKIKDNVPHDLVWMPDGSGLITAIARSTGKLEFWKYDLTQHTVLKKWTNPQTDSGWTTDKYIKIDIECDSNTLWYTDQSKTLFKYNLGTSTQMTPFAQFTDTNYVYAGFKLLPDGGVLVAVTGSGDGPHNSLCLNSDASTCWTDEINPTNNIYHAFKRSLTDGSHIKTITLSLDNNNINDIATSMGCYYHFCSNGPLVRVFAQCIT